jgi:hypothetical protein
VSDQHYTPRDFFTNPGPKWWEEWLSDNMATRERIWNAVKEFLADRANDISVRRER